MKVKLLENVQGAGISGVRLDNQKAVNELAEGVSYEVAETLGAWLLQHRKALELTGGKGIAEHDNEPQFENVHYGAQPEPQLRHDDEIHEIMTTSNQATRKPTTKRSKK